MSAACQPVPTIRQREQLAAFNAKHHGVRQYEQNQPRISTVEAAGMACCATEADEVSGLTWARLTVFCIVGLGMWAAMAAGTVLAIDAFGMAGLIGSILGACAIVGAVAKIGRFV